MNTLTRLSTAALLLSSLTVSAQGTKYKTQSDHQENIIIRKKGDSKEKMTIVIDGDKVTVNGKPVEDFKNDNVQIITDSDDFFMPPVPPVPPVIARGGVKTFRGNFMSPKTNKAFLGIMTENGDGGAKVNDITKESAADKAGLKKGDVITKINDTKIEDADDVYQSIGKMNPDDKVTITYQRDGKENTTTAKLDKNLQLSRAFTWNGDDSDMNFNFAPEPFEGGKGFTFNYNRKPRLGMRVQDVEEGSGVKVLDADNDEPAGKAGIKEGDVITEINGKEIKDVDELREATKDLKEGDVVKLQYKRNNAVQSAEVKIPKRLKTSDL